jgi:hypothetical protein
VKLWPLPECEPEVGSLIGTSLPHVHAAQFGMADELREMLDADPNLVDEVDDRRMTALMGAAHGGHMDLVRELLARGASPILRDDHGVSALDYAIREDRADVVLALVEHVRAAGADVFETLFERPNRAQGLDTLIECFCWAEVRGHQRVLALIEPHERIATIRLWQQVGRRSQDAEGAEGIQHGHLSRRRSESPSGRSEAVEADGEASLLSERADEDTRGRSYREEADEQQLVARGMAELHRASGMALETDLERVPAEQSQSKEGENWVWRPIDGTGGGGVPPLAPSVSMFELAPPSSGPAPSLPDSAFSMLAMDGPTFHIGADAPGGDPRPSATGRRHGKARRHPKA